VPGVPKVLKVLRVIEIPAAKSGGDFFV